MSDEQRAVPRLADTSFRHSALTLGLAMALAGGCAAKKDAGEDGGESSTQTSSDATTNASMSGDSTDTSADTTEGTQDSGDTSDSDTGDETTGDTGGAEGICTDSGGTWVENTCDHYVCGFPNECAAVIPGCDCGSGKNFDEVDGCVVDPTCEDTQLGEVCDASAPTCVEGASCCYPCGMQGCDFVCTADDPGTPGECPPPPP